MAEPAAALHITAGVGGDAHQPALLAGAAEVFKAVKVLPGLQKSLLHGVLRKLTVAQQHIAAAQHGAAVAFKPGFDQGLPLASPLCGHCPTPSMI